MLKSLHFQLFVALALIAMVQVRADDAATPAANPLAVMQNGVSLNAAGSFGGYSLVAPMNSTSTYLVDMQGRIVHEWKSDYTPALSAYLLEDGHLLRPAANRAAGGFGGPGAGGQIQEFDWDGNLVWDYVIEIEGIQPHHDICKLPSGNVLVVAHEHKTAAEAIAAGRKPESVTERLLPDFLLEIKPTGTTTGEVVWEWHAWDHLVQDTDKALPSYGEVSEHPELVDINFGSREFDRMMADPQQLARLQSLGYVGGNPQRPRPDAARPDGTAPPDRPAPEGDRAGPPRGDGPPPDGGGRPDGNRGPRGPMQGDWMHVNSVAYNAQLDQIVISVHNFSEIWIIDHGTTTAEAASHTGGRRGHGGDLLYRWGNPQAYRNGSRSDQRLFAQHCAAWIPAGSPGAGHLMVFNNGQGRPDGSYSSVDEIELPLAADGTYERDEFLAFGPDRACWTFSAPEKSSFFSMLISGAQRLPNGNTFICSGNQAMLFEVTSSGEIVWVYKHPGGGMGFDGGNMGMFPDFVRRMLQIDKEQGKQLTALQGDVDKQLAGILTDEQRQRMSQPFRPPFGGPPGGRDGGRPDGNRPPDGNPPPDRGPGGDRPVAGGPGRGGRGGRGPGGFRGFRPPRFGEVIPSFVVDSLELTDEQKTRIATIQESVDTQLKDILTEDQRTQIDNMSQAFAGGFGPPGGNRPGPDGNPPGGNGDPPRPPDQADSNGNRPPRPDGPRPDGNPPRGGGRGFGPMFGGGGGPGGGPGGFFRSYRYGPDYTGLAGRELTPGQKLEEVAAAPRRPGDPSRPPLEDEQRDESR